MLKNMTEILAEQKLNELMKSPDYEGCTCSQCREDILAYALNRLPAQYVSTDTGALYAKVNQYATNLEFDILRQLALAMRIVGQSPRHNKKKEKRGEQE